MTNLIKVYDGPNSIHKSWFRGKYDYYCSNTGYYFTSHGSMPYYKTNTYDFNGQTLTEEVFNQEFKLVESMPGTGGSVHVYTKK